jgi:uncharacterized membrane protein YbaN (DUF454 family)
VWTELPSWFAVLLVIIWLINRVSPELASFLAKRNSQKCLVGKYQRDAFGQARKRYAVVRKETGSVERM